MRHIDRRSFLKASVLAMGAPLAARAAGAAAPEGAKLKKALQWGMLPKNLSEAQRFALAKKCGFEGIECEAGDVVDLEVARRLGELGRQTGVPVHSLVFGGWHAPFSSPDAAVIEKGLDGMRTALHSARICGADTVLLVPAVVTETVAYGDAYKRSQEHIAKLLPLAAELKITIAIENVWNKFLLSPLEFARYVDEFDHPYLKAYFDVGNVILFGYSQDWIRTLNKRIAKIHLKDFKRQGYQWTNLREGDVNWKEVRKALDEVGYSGYMTTELRGGDEAYLTDLAGRIDLIIAGK
ncbi:MAG TPA: sugar phosphate isomerase/epimerase family protein [Anaerohalosphaeraceae bacterium]|jgi:L-ribulose-5-phosphate 3-epimerase|nr:sugar phosphate isomerase/epimerase family protein [Anaerohalosphaeraceae bacterium]HRT51187.1 sugar phosphate isomerase/epimerase family protein [Anaerohalosphaeraceae bacterium]HRT87449.1 sugar phosphate isomerase/epimerase family protein [Anaerohalosphaeraceae bacterium]